MGVRPSKKDHDTTTHVRWEGEVPPPRHRVPLLLRIFKGFAGSLSGSLVLLGIVAGIGLWRSGEQFVTGIKMALTPAEPEEQVDVRTVVVQQVQGASELTTAVFTMEAVVPATSTRTLANYEIGKTTLIYIANGEVEAGVDLSEIRPNDIQVVDENTLRVRLPAPKIVDSKIDVSQSQVFDYNRGFLGLGPDRAPVLQDKAQAEALVRIVNAACEQDILQQASDRAELVVGKLLQNAGYTQVLMESRPSDNVDCVAAGASTLQ
ncbi:MAG: DUF4230 domain-containing protein [Cyanobacteria bacterium J06638_28]